MTSSAPKSSAVLRSAPFLSALAGVAIIAAGSIGAVVYLTRDAPQAPPIAAAPAPSPAPSPAPVAPEVAPPAPRPAPKDPAVVREAHAREARTPMVTRLVPSRGRFMITRAIEQHAARLPDCFPARDPAAPPVLPVGRRSIVRADSPGILLLQLEPQDDAIRILDAAVERRGTGTDAELACAQRVLKGLRLPMPGTEPGEQVSMSYPLP